MAKALSKSQLAAAIAEKNGLSKKQAGEILEHIAALAYKHAKDTFTLPGIGRLVLTAVYERDYPLVQGSILFIALLFMLSNLIVDLLYAYLDPRIRYE